MKRKQQIILLTVSMVISAFSVIRMTYFVSRRSPERYVHGILIGLTACLIIYTLYKSFIKRMSKGNFDQTKFAKLFELENPYPTGEIEFYFTIEEPKSVKFSILTKGLEEIHVLKDEAVKSGGHIVRFDSSILENGVYFYCLETENQKTMKRVHIQHDKLTV
jgi:hypothetical protein